AARGVADGALGGVARGVSRVPRAHRSSGRAPGVGGSRLLAAGIERADDRAGDRARAGRGVTMRRERLNAAAGGIAATVAAALVCGCQTEERVVRYRPMLSSVPGAQFGTQPTGARFRGQYVDPTSARDANGMLTS